MVGTDPLNVSATDPLSHQSSGLRTNACIPFLARVFHYHTPPPLYKLRQSTKLIRSPCSLDKGVDARVQREKIAW